MTVAAVVGAGPRAAPLARGLFAIYRTLTDLGGYFCGRGDCPIVGLGSFGTLAFLGPKGRPMDGTAHSKGPPASERTMTKFIGRKRSCQRKPLRSREAGGWLLQQRAGARRPGRAAPSEFQRRRHCAEPRKSHLRRARMSNSGLSNRRVRSLPKKITLSAQPHFLTVQSPEERFKPLDQV